MASMPVIVFLLIVYTLNKETQGAQEVQEGTKSCASEVFERIDKCCKMPKLLPFDSFKTCMTAAKKSANSQTTSKQQQNNNNNKSPPKRHSRAVVKGTHQNQNKKDSQTKKVATKIQSAALPSGPTCLMNCVLKTQNMLTNDGDIDIPEARKQFLSAADDTWTPLVKNAINSCETKLSKIDPISLPNTGHGKEECKQQPALFISCIRRHLALTCPSKFASTDATCSDKLNTLQSCNPYLYSQSQNSING